MFYCKPDLYHCHSVLQLLMFLPFIHWFLSFFIFFSLQASPPKRNCTVWNTSSNHLWAVYAMWHWVRAKLRLIYCPYHRWWPPNMKTSTKAVRTNVIRVTIYVSLDRDALITTMAYRVIVLVHTTRASIVIFIVSIGYGFCCCCRYPFHSLSLQDTTFADSYLLFDFTVFCAIIGQEG